MILTGPLTRSEIMRLESGRTLSSRAVPEHQHIQGYRIWSLDIHALCALDESLLCPPGAGVSAESGVPTFRGKGGLWRRWNATDLGKGLRFVTMCRWRSSTYDAC